MEQEVKRVKEEKRVMVLEEKAKLEGGTPEEEQEKITPQSKMMGKDMSPEKEPKS
jgi:hypothetical protein